jgi:hypothetical protein
LGEERGNHYVHFYRNHDGTVVVSGSSRSEGIWTRTELNKPNFVDTKDVVYFGNDTQMASYALSQVYRLSPGSAYKVDNRAIGVDYNGKVFITDHGSKEGTYIRKSVGLWVELGTDDTMVHLGKFGTIMIRQTDGPKRLPPVVPAGHPPVVPAGRIATPGTPATPGHANVIGKPGVPPAIAQPGFPPAIGKPGTPPVIAKPHTPPVIANPGHQGQQGQFRVQQRPVIAAPALGPVETITPLADHFKGNLKDPKFWQGAYPDIVLSEVKGAVRAPDRTVTPVYETSREARGAAGFVLRMFRRVLTDPVTSSAPDLQFNHEVIRGNDGRNYLVPLIEFPNGFSGRIHNATTNTYGPLTEFPAGYRGRIVLEPNRRLMPAGLVSNGKLTRIEE